MQTSNVEPSTLVKLNTLGELVHSYLTEPVSPFHEMRYQTRVRRNYIVRQMVTRYGETPLSDIRAKTLLQWYSEVSERKKKIASAHSFINSLRTLVRFGLLVHEDKECERLAGILSALHFPVGAPRTERMTYEQAEAICNMAHEFARPSIALAQAIQFECILRQKDILGEIVPIEEPIDGLPWRDRKWTCGIVWEEIDDQLILRHTTSKTKKQIEFDLKNCPLVLKELSYLATVSPGKKTGPVILCETTGLPWIAGEFRRHWRDVAEAAGIPKSLRNQDSRAGGITEAVEAGAQVDQIRQTATHSSANTTQRYIRGSFLESSSAVSNLRVARRQARTPQ